VQATSLTFTHESATAVFPEPDESNLHAKIFFIGDNFINNSTNKSQNYSIPEPRIGQARNPGRSECSHIGHCTGTAEVLI